LTRKSEADVLMAESESDVSKFDGEGAKKKPRVGGLKRRLAEANRQLYEAQFESTETFLKLQRCQRSLSAMTRCWAEVSNPEAGLTRGIDVQ